ncbi:MAG TPA: YihY/virulence factor BrkB family protein [Feifaniaceae bacterium]|nr:YihY/virulence factor BrkB family protein [Feifaniaceae bacterium]
MKKIVRQAMPFLKQLYERFRADEVPSLGAEFAYHLLLAFFPFLIFLVTVLTYTPLLQPQSLADLLQVLPADAYAVVAGTVNEIFRTNRPNILSFSVILAVWSSSSGFMAVSRGLNRAYDVKETRKFYAVRGMAILFTLLIACSILLEMVAIVFGDMLILELSAKLGWSAFGVALTHILQLILPVGMLFLLFLFLYTIIPNRKLRVREVLPGAAFTSVVWVISSFLFSTYVNNFSNFARLYGSLGGVIVLLLWLYLSSMVMLIGSEINATLYFEKGRGKDLEEQGGKNGKTE